MRAQRAAPVFAVSDLAASLAYYQDVLGFQEDFRVGNYAGLKHGGAALHLTP